MIYGIDAADNLKSWWFICCRCRNNSLSTRRTLLFTNNNSKSKQLLDLGFEGIGKVGTSEGVSYVRGQETDLRPAVEGLAVVFQRKERLPLQKSDHGVGDLDLAASAPLLRRG